ncbi:hypothetical protein HY375_02300 [Candidatus Berkelbacteria bacterium]|nr:hypothetical protein [Candidatus Berkelbacteria bacterium]
MTPLTPAPWRPYSWLTGSLFLTAGLLHGGLWWYRQTHVQFNVVALLIGSGILLGNLIVVLTTARYDDRIGFILGGATVFTQLSLFILLVMANQGRLQ